MTRSLCGTCLKVVDARIIVRDGRLFLSKRIPRRATPAQSPAPPVRLFHPKSPSGLFPTHQRLFASVSSLLFSLIRQFYRLAAGSPRLATSAVIAFQPFGDFLRPNAHWHPIVLEGGYTSDGRFLFLPIHHTATLCEAFRRPLIKLLLSKALISEDFPTTLLCGKNPGFSVDNHLRINGADQKTRVALPQYIARPPLSLHKLSSLPSRGMVRYTSDYNPAIGHTIKIWNARDFIAAATLFIPPRGLRLISYFGLYPSRSRWQWSPLPHVIPHAPRECKETHGVGDADSTPHSSSATVPQSACRSAWARLIAMIYQVDLLVCPRCSSHMRILAVIVDPREVKRILPHLIRIARPPPGLDPASFA